MCSSVGAPPPDTPTSTHTCSDTTSKLQTDHKPLLTLFNESKWGGRVVVPAPGRESVLIELHGGHPGTSRMKSFARSLVGGHSNLEWRFLPKNISAGDKPVVVCGVILHWNRNRVLWEEMVDFVEMWLPGQIFKSSRPVSFKVQLLPLQQKCSILRTVVRQEVSTPTPRVYRKQMPDTPPGPYTGAEDEISIEHVSWS